MAFVEDATVDIKNVTVTFTAEELKVLHNVMHRVQLGMTGYPKAASDILGVLDDIFGYIDETDHYVEMYDDGEGSLYWHKVQKNF